MTKRKADSRERLMRGAEEVTYRRGFGNTAIGDIARRARVPLGNVYYYFQTKDQINEAIIELRVTRFRKLLEEFNGLSSPRERLCAFVNTKIKNRDRLARNGCPVGGLCSELRKLGGASAEKSTILFAEALRWMEAQFREMGKGEESRGLAVHLLSATQGASVLGHTFQDPEMIVMEAERLKEWIRGL